MDTAIWLNNKIGSDDNHWSSSSIASQFNASILKNIYDCFLQLELKSKIKLLLTFLEIPLHSIGELQQTISDIVNLAECDPDEWVRVAANIVKDYPTLHTIDKRLENVTSSFQGTIQKIKNELESIQPSNSLSMVPLESPYLNRAALNQMVPNQPTHMKHFTLRRRPKSAELRAKITQKATDAANQRRASQTSATPSSKSLKRINSLPTGRLPPVSHSKSLSKTSSLPKKTKLLDIEDQPLPSREQKKRKKLLAMEACIEEAKQRKHAAEKSKIAGEDEDKPSAVSPYSGVDTPTDSDSQYVATPSSEEAKDGDNSSSSSLNTSNLMTPAYAVLPGTTPSLPTETPAQRYAANIPTTDTNLIQNSQLNYNETPELPVMPGSNNNLPAVPSVNEMTTDNIGNMINVDPTASFDTQTLQRELQLRVQQEHEFRLHQEQQFNQQLFQQHARQYGTNIPIGAPGSMATSNMTTSGAIGLSHQLPPMQTPHVGIPAQPTVQSQQKKGLSLTRDQMLAAQEMFRSANRVTRAEKALILGFMAGARENPFPKQGPVITIKLSEDREVMQQPEGPQSMIIEMLFEMNYETGHWRRLKRTKVVSQQTPT